LPASFRMLSATLATGVASVLSVTGAASAASATASATASASATTAASLTAGPITLANNVTLSGYDAATDGSGRAYIGWIGDSGSGREVHLCTLPRGATSCLGGVRTVSPGGGFSSSSDAVLRVLVTPAGKVTLVWFHDTVASENGPQGSEIAIATSQSGGPLSGPQDVATAPSFGSMLDATFGPGGSIWVVTEPSSGNSVQVRPGLTASPVKVSTPYGVESARLAFSGSMAVLAIKKDGAITVPVSYATDRGGSWSGFRQLARTWTSDAEFGMARTPSGIRLIATVNNANYFPVVSRWTASGFSRPTLTGDRNNCTPSSHDTTSDASGRLADVSAECGDLAIANLTDTAHAAVTRFNVHGTFAGGQPQLTTTPRGRAWVVWSIESSVSDKLLVAPILLPGRVVTASRASGGNRVTLHGPASCLPPVNVTVGVKGSPARHWRVTGHALRLGGRTLRSATLRGASLVAGRTYTLTGTVSFANGGSRRTVTAQLRFRSCPNP
jgi:hypothetical protein